MVLGRLKEQDALITLIRRLIIEPYDGLVTISTIEAVRMVQQMIEEHVVNPRGSKLQKYAPSVATLFLPLDLTRALMEYDARTKITMRRHVPPTFKEIRHIMNIATIHAVTPHLRMVTFDADDTIYEDGGTVSRGSPMVDIIVRLLRAGVVVSLVTAAGYPGNVARYESRLRGLLDTFQLFMDMGAPIDMLERFLVMGGECNYLHRIAIKKGRIGLEVVPPDLWKDGRGVRWSSEAITELLDTAEATLRETATVLGLDIRIIRKERAVGMIRNQPRRFSYEVLEEVALAVQVALKDLHIPHCAFNGGNDVWVDVGNKALGVRALQNFMGGTPKQTLHVGDRFTRTGNDTRAREAANTVWVSDPKETMFVMRLLLRDLHEFLASDDASSTEEGAGASLSGKPELQVGDASGVGVAGAGAGATAGAGSVPECGAGASGDEPTAGQASEPALAKAAAAVADAPSSPQRVPKDASAEHVELIAPPSPRRQIRGLRSPAMGQLLLRARQTSFDSLTLGDDDTEMADLEDAFSAMADED